MTEEEKHETAEAEASPAPAEVEKSAPAAEAADAPVTEVVDAPEAQAAEPVKPASKPRAVKPKAEATPDEPASKATRPDAEHLVVAPVVRAQAKYVRSSARKARLVCDNIRGKSVQDARAILAHTPRAVARDWSKLLESAVANAEHNHELDGEDLVIKAVHADEGPTIKRFRPRAMGRATRVQKGMSHITVILGERA